MERCAPSRRAARPTGRPGALHLGDNLTHRHPVDGVGVLAADGKSSCLITVERKEQDGALASGAAGQEQLYVRTTGGTIRDKAGNVTSRVQLSGGKATFQLVAEAVPRFVTVTVLGQGLRATLSFEFVPSSELPAGGREPA